MFSVEQLVANRIWFDLRSRVFFCKPKRPFGTRVGFNRAFDLSHELLLMRWKLGRGREVSLHEAAKAIALVPFASFFNERKAWVGISDGFSPSDLLFLDRLRLNRQFDYNLPKEDVLEVCRWDGHPISVTWPQIASLSRWAVGEPLRPSDYRHRTLAWALRSYVDVLCTPARLRETESWGEVLE